MRQPPPRAWYVLAEDRYVVRALNLLHWPYSIWHLSYVVIGAAAASAVHWDRLGAALGAFFLGMGVSAHLFDALAGDPLRLRLPPAHLTVAAVTALLGAVGIGVGYSIALSYPWFSVLIALGIFAVLAYDLELFGGAFHSDHAFALFWAVLPAAAGFLIMGPHFTKSIVPLAVVCYATARAQRALSTRSRYVRRVIREPTDDLAIVDGALKAMSLAMSTLAVALVLFRL